MKLAFVLPAGPGGGGAHSVVQESSELAALGVDVVLVVTARDEVAYRSHYPMWSPRLVVESFEAVEDLATLLSGADFAIATTYASIGLLATARQTLGDRAPRAAYYVQDYEPLFFAPGSAEWAEARASYGRIPGTLLFAKTHWLCDRVSRTHGCRVHKVEPSLDHGLFRPDFGRRRRGLVCAMVRSSTPRRGPRRTLRLLNRLAAREGDGVELHVFGSTIEELKELGVVDAALHIHGPLHRESVAEVLRACDVFVDLSDYQAFGRTGLEAMASGCIPIMPMLGAAPELITDSIDGFIVDTTDDESVFSTVTTALRLSATERAAMQRAAVARASGFSVRRAAISEHRLFADALEEG